MQLYRCPEAGIIVKHSDFIGAEVDWYFLPSN
jgi:hypothetical protein